jgi:hypothetical protein
VADEYPIPEEYQNRSAAWKKAFQHAKEHDNPDKAAVLFAEAHGDAEEFTKAQRGAGAKSA